MHCMESSQFLYHDYYKSVTMKHVNYYGPKGSVTQTSGPTPDTDNGDWADTEDDW